jgi:hypothetical protein
MAKLAFFMRGNNRVVDKYLYQYSTHEIEYENPNYFYFIVSDEAADWITNENKTKECYLLHDKLKAVLDENSIDYNGFFGDNSSNQKLDISDKTLAEVMPMVDTSKLREVGND